MPRRTVIHQITRRQPLSLRGGLLLALCLGGVSLLGNSVSLQGNVVTAEELAKSRAATSTSEKTARTDDLSRECWWYARRTDDSSRIQPAPHRALSD